MRSREAILAAATEHGQGETGRWALFLAQLEVLLDIRERLPAPAAKK